MVDGELLERQYRNNFYVDPQSLTKQFKRSLYEVFLQKYHKETGCELDNEMDDVHNFARYVIGNDTNNNLHK